MTAPARGHKIRLRLQHLEQGFQRGVRLMMKTRHSLHDVRSKDWLQPFPCFWKIGGLRLVSLHPCSAASLAFSFCSSPPFRGASPRIWLTHQGSDPQQDGHPLGNAATDGIDRSLWDRCVIGSKCHPRKAPPRCITWKFRPRKRTRFITIKSGKHPAHFLKAH